MGQLKICLLGSFAANIDANPITKFESAKVRALLAYLTVEYQEPHSREKLIGMLWPEMPEKRARASLSQALYNLRQLIDNQDTPSRIITVDQQNIQFSPADDSWVDVHKFRACFEARENHTHRRLETCHWCAKQLEAASRLYRGEFLAGFLLPDCQAFDEWVLLERERLQRQAEVVFHSLANHHVTRGNYPQAIHFARRQLELMPWRESAHRQLMRLLALDGQRSAALAQYQVCCRVLAEELDVTPQPKTAELFEHIRDGEIIPAPFTPPPHNLPAPLTPFVGRQTELEKLRQCLNDPACRLITLVGVGGSGKTRLALEAARTELLSYPQGVYLISLAPLQTVTAIIPAVAEALELTFREADDPRQQLLDYLHEKSALLIMDNFEHLLEGIDWVLELLRAAPNVTVVATSRSRLNVMGEHIMLISGLNFPEECAVLPMGEGIGHYSAIRLFVDAAQRVFPEFDLTPENTCSVARICRLVEGMPLAILLAASGVGVFLPGEIADRIIRSFDILETEWRDLPLRQRSMRAVLDHSWNMLSRREQELMQSLSVFRGGFSREATEQIMDASPVFLQGLVNKIFLQHASMNRYDIHELTRQYAREKLASSRTTETNVNDLHARFYIAALQRWGAALKTSFPEDALASLDIESGNLHVAWDWATSSSEVSLIAQGIEGLCIYYDARVRFTDGQMACQKAVEVLKKKAGGSHALTRVRSQAWLAHFERQLENTELAQNLLKECFELMDDDTGNNGDIEVINAFIHLEQGYLALLNDHESANHWFQESLILYQSSGDEWGANQSWKGLARSPLTWAIAVNRARSGQKGMPDK